MFVYSLIGIIASFFGGASFLVLVRGWNLRRTRKQIVEHRLALWHEKERALEAKQVLRKLLKEEKKP
jgi:hypothetical protein